MHPRSRLRPVFLLVLATLLAPITAFTLPGFVAPASAVEVCDPFATVDVNGKEYVVQNNVWGASTPQCIDVNGTSFRVTQSGHNNTGGTPASYPSIFKGCHWGNCTVNSGLPLQVGSIGTATSNWSVSASAAGAWNVAYDLWFHSTPSAGNSNPDSAELMIWLNSQGGVSPAGSIVASNVQIAGATWNVWFTQFSDWDYIAYQRTSPTNSVSGFNLGAFINDARNRGFLQPSWYLIAVEAGFEIWQGGIGLATNSFSFNASGGGGGGTTTTSPTSTSSTTTTLPPGGGCQVTYQVQSQWPNGFVAGIVVRNNGASAVNGWTLSWTFPGNQQVVSMWNATPTQSGRNVSARNLAWNATIPAGGSASFGFQGSYSGSNPAPTQFALNGTTCATAS